MSMEPKVTSKTYVMWYGGDSFCVVLYGVVLVLRNDVVLCSVVWYNMVSIGMV